MLVSSMRIRFDRHTGKEISREVIDTYDISEDELADLTIRAILGKSPEEAARYIRSELASALPRVSNGPSSF